MARTYKKPNPRNSWNVESGEVKKAFRRNFRARCKQALREGRFDLMPVWKSTQGWLTW